MNQQSMLGSTLKVIYDKSPFQTYMLEVDGLLKQASNLKELTKSILTETTN